MNNPLSSSQSDFRLKSLKNKEEDERSLLDLKNQSLILPGNPCSFPKTIRVINSTSREDRWQRFNEINSRLFLDFDVQRWGSTLPGPSFPEVADAIFRSFCLCLEESFKTSESVIIMEDDAYLAEGGIDKLRMAYQDLPSDWDVLIGNHYFFGQMRILSDHLAKPSPGGSTLNFAVFRNTILPKIEANKHRRGRPDLKDFDHFLTSEEIPINNYTVWPMISREFPSFSDHKKKNLDSTIRIRENAFKYRFIDQDSYYPSLEGW